MGKNKMIIYITDRVYFGGDVVVGVVEMNLQSKIKSRGIRMLFSGYEDVQFTVQHGQNSSTTYHEKWIFLHYRMDLAGAPRSERKKAEAVDVPPGVYRWPFAFRLPDYLPPTCRYVYGSCRYRVSAYVDIPRGFDLTKKMDFIVGGLIWNPYEFISPKPPPQEENNKKSFFFAKGKMTMTAQLDTENYFVGDTARIKLFVDNQSSKPVNKIKLTLESHLRFEACGAVRPLSETLHRQKFNHKIPPKTKETFDLFFTVPNLKHTSQVPNVNHLGKLIQCRFVLWVRLDIPWAIDLKCHHGINIMQRDPKAIGLPPPGPLVPPTGKKWLKMLTPQTASVGAYDAPPSPEMGGPGFTQPVMYYPQIAGYDFPVDTAVVPLTMGTYKAEDDEAFLLD